MKMALRGNEADIASWTGRAIEELAAEAARAGETSLIRHRPRSFEGISLYLKDEASHPTGSLKHRLARSLLSYALCNGAIGPEAPLIEASSGSTAVSIAYFARLIGLPFIAVVPIGTAAAKIEAIKGFGGTIHFVEHACLGRQRAAHLAREVGGHFIDQFTFAERATDWRNGNIAESMFDQMRLEDFPLPQWIVCGAGTGGTSCTIGRYIRANKLPSKLCVVDPTQSIFHRNFSDRSMSKTSDGEVSIIEGIGRTQVEASFIPNLIDRVAAVPDAESIGAARALSDLLGRPVGGSTGTNLVGCCQLMSEMSRAGTRGSIATILCDSGSRYVDTYFDNEWLTARGIRWEEHARRYAEMLA